MFRRLDGHVVRALTIAGSDSGGGAGIQADIKTMHQFGVYGMSAITALTAQNTLGVQAIHDVPPEFLQRQLMSISEDLGLDAAKTGMLSSAAIIHTAADFIGVHRAVPFVVDPVMVAKGGAPLLRPDAVDALKHRLTPLATVITPNLPEAEVLCGYPLADWEACHQAARDISALGAKLVVIKGGHAPETSQQMGPGGSAVQMGPGSSSIQIDSGSSSIQMGSDGSAEFFNAAAFATDIVYSSSADAFTYLVTPRVTSEKTHGTGCTFSAAMTALLAMGTEPLEAIAGAKAFVYDAIERAEDWDVGHGHGPTDHTAPVTSNYLPQIGRFNLYKDGRWTVL